MSNRLRKIGVLTSGGDAPGMNAAIRSVVRSSIFYNCEVVGVYGGYKGLLKSNFIPMHSDTVSKTINKGGTILKSSRCPEFLEPQYRAQAVENMKAAGIDGLVVIGGDGSFRGANQIYQEFQFPVIGVPGTIDNDIFGTDYTIGFDTAINTAVEAIDKIRDTADSHNLVFFVEVMGRDAGFIALNTGLAVGAEAIMVPEFDTPVKKLCDYLINERRNNKSSGVVIVAEGNKSGGAIELAAEVKRRLPQYETRVSILGHIQRGGSPTCNDRVLASILANAAVKGLLNGQTGVMAGIQNDKVVYTPLIEVCSHHNTIDKSLHKLAHILSL